MLIVGGFSRCGNPLIILPDTHLFFEILESDLHMVLKYFIQIIPMAKQVKETLKLLYEEGKKEAIIQLWSESYCDDKSFFIPTVRALIGRACYHSLPMEMPPQKTFDFVFLFRDEININVKYIFSVSWFCCSDR